MKRLHGLGRVLAAFCMATIALVTAEAVLAQDTLKIAVGQRGLWDTSISELGQRTGIFKKHGLVLEILYTQGGGETQQAVISGSVDVGIAVGIMGVLAAYSKGAPVRVIGAEMTGGADLCLVRDRELADQDAEGYRRQDDCLFDPWSLDARDRQCVHQGAKSQKQPRGDRWTAGHADASHVRPNRCGLVGASVRSQPSR